MPKKAAVLAPAYARALFETGDVHSALEVLLYISRINPGPRIEAAVIDLLASLGNEHAAVERLGAALRRFAVAPEGALYHSAHRLHLADAAGMPGWVGLSPAFEIIGEGRASLERYVEISSSDNKVRRNAFLERASERFRVAPLRVSEMKALRASAGGLDLLGSGLVYPPAFDFDGRAAADSFKITGWARLGWAPDQLPEILILDRFGKSVRLNADRGPTELSRWHFKIDIRESGLRGGEFSISAILPDGSAELFPDTPLLLEPNARSTALAGVDLAETSSRTRGRKVKADDLGRRLPNVIIPVYLGYDETLACLKSVRASVSPDVEIIVIDDASPDKALAATLRKQAATGSITLLRNKKNLGFAGTVNRALALYPKRDAVLLNSDTVVFGDWLQRLTDAAYSSPDIGTVTPLTNQGSVASYTPSIDGECTVQQAFSLNEFAAAANNGQRLDLPVGIGFCLYLKRACLNQIGTLDADVFGSGYGEESDLCLRARAKGWRNVLAADVYVFHSVGRSFGTRRAALLERSQRLLNLRHPGYDELVQKFLKADPLQPIRRRFDESRLRAMDCKFVLLVSLMLEGGVNRYIEERCLEIRRQGLSPLILKPARSRISGCVLTCDDASVGDLRYRIPREHSALQAVLTSLAIEHIELHHFVDFDSRVIEMVRELPVPCDIYIHDFIWLCPRITLTDGSGSYCGEPSIATCETCIQRNGSRLDRAMTVADLRSRSAIWLSSARRVIAPSWDTANRIQRYFPRAVPCVEPWELELATGFQRNRTRAGKTIRVAVIGAIGVHKGYQVLLECARDAAARDLPIEFVVIGYTERDLPLTKTGKVFVTGRYVEQEVLPLLQREQPDVIFFPSVWPETWCYTLSHALGTGVPILAFDIGAIAERLRDSGYGVLVPLGAKTSDLNRLMVELGQNGEGLASYVKKHDELDNNARNSELQSEFDSTIFEPTNNLIEMAIPTGNRTSIEIPKDALGASVQVFTLPRGIYLFSIRTSAVSSALGSSGKLTLPAVHVALGPGVPSDDVEIMSGPSTRGAWLCEQGNVLVVKISGDSATMILTSVRTPGGAPLAVKVEALDSRNDADSAADKPAIAAPAAPVAPAVTAVVEPHRGLSIQIAAHVRSRGDLTFIDAPWAGRVGRGLWLEAFSVKPLEKLQASDIEYKGLTASGFETPWLSDGNSCGTRGMSVPLVGFAVRLKGGNETARYDCEYSGYFQSGITAGPFRNGTPCRSTVPNDSLEGIRVQIVKRQLGGTPADAASRVSRSMPLGPSFGRFRDDPDAAAEQKKPATSVSTAASGSNLSTAAGKGKLSSAKKAVIEQRKLPPKQVGKKSLPVAATGKRPSPIKTAARRKR